MTNTVCLTMIERNEAPVLPRSLGSFKALKGIDPVYCIVDGGSKDGSSSTILETMGEIPGEVHLIPQPEPLDDFAAARNGGSSEPSPWRSGCSSWMRTTRFRPPQAS